MNDPFTGNCEIDIEVERYELFEAPWHEFAFDRREFLKVLGGGILIGLLVPSETTAQPRRGRGGNAASQVLGAWLHIDEAGKVAVFCGKVEVGQNVRTMAAQVIAEELRLKPAEIETVLADTDRVPYDAGTFGSRSSPAMSPQLRRAGAAARQLLLQLAAEIAKVDAGTLELVDGTVTHPPSKKSWTFSELTKGQKLTQMISGDVATTPSTRGRCWGPRSPR